MAKSKKARAAAELRRKYPEQSTSYLDMQSRANARSKAAACDGRVYGTMPWRMEVQRRRRLAELKALMQRRYGVAGVDDEAEHAHIDIVELARHAFASAEPIEMVESAVKYWCGGCSLKTISNILKAAQVWKRLDAVSVGRRVMLTARERQELAITTMRAADETPLDGLRKCVTGQTRRVGERRRHTCVKQRRHGRDAEGCAFGGAKWRRRHPCKPSSRRFNARCRCGEPQTAARAPCGDTKAPALTHDTRTWGTA